MPVHIAQAVAYFWGDGVVMAGLQEKLNGLRMGAALAMAVGPELVDRLSESLAREGWAVERRGGSLCVRKR